jgi:tetratricopeptide (TPR) repeat protein
MFKNWRPFITFLALGLMICGVRAQAPAKPEAKPDYSKEAFVIEQTSIRVAFENDGTGTRESSGRIRIQSDAGVQRYGLLTFAYQNSTESVDIDYVRVHKPDGSTVSTPAENTQDMATEITREAPFYSDLREKHVAVKGLSVGDVLEFQANWHSTKPLAPGQFWYAYNFSHDGIILQEKLEISLPRDRAVKWKSPELKAVVTEDRTRRVYTWTTSHLEQKSSEQEKADQNLRLYQTARGQLPAADVQISSFRSWEDVGRWYGDLQQERIKPTPEIRAKAQELTKNASDENARLRAIYNYVSTEFRYIGIAFGIGRYQPHTAAEVLANQYGDCKDKQTLLASLLDAVGIKAYPALISASHEIDLDVPSPGQFDHVIGMIPQASGSVWLDTTPEVAPYAYLLSGLRGKQALVIPEDKPPTLILTPAAPPSKASESFKIEAKLSDTGTLEGKVERTVQGDDSEVLLRLAFRRVPMPQWKDLVQQVSYNSGFAGAVSEVTASSPEKTDEPFHFAYIYTRKEYPNWSERQISSPLPPLLGLTPDSKPSHPIFLGEMADIQYESRVAVPKGYSPELPGKVDLKEDFGEYRASYEVKDGVLITQRRFVAKLSEIPLNEYDAFKKFAKAVGDDHNLYIALSSGDSTANSLHSAIGRLPGSDNPEAARAYDDAGVAAQNNNVPGAIDILKHAVEADPHFTRARMWLAELYAFTGQRDAALEQLRAARKADPGQPVTYKALVASLMGMQRYEEAVSVLQEVVKTNPEDAEAFSNLSGALLALKRYSEAADAVESAIKLRPDQGSLYAQLGYAYLHAGNDDKSLTAFKKAVEIDPRPLWFNNAGYELADANKQLPLALEYAEKAVREEEEASAKVKLSDLKKEDLAYTSALAAYWDTLGWVYFRMGNLDQAEKYINSAWLLSQSPTVGDHLAQVYEMQHRKESAINTYRLALYQFSLRPRGISKSDEEKQSRSRLEHLSPGGASDSRNMIATSDELNRMRTIKLPRLITKSGSAEFFVLLAPGSKVEDAKFISGSEELKSSAKALRPVDFKLRFPDERPARLLRRGILSCFEYSGCSFVLYNIADVHSVD